VRMMTIYHALMVWLIFNEVVLLRKLATVRA
jgi:hypothetical protein